jgi:SAM-dependent methyltransferase
MSSEGKSDREMRALVAQGYDRMGGAYTKWALDGADPAREAYTRLLLEELPPGSRILDLGCGAGLPTTRALARRHRVIGVDLSFAQVARARRNVPQAAFLQADMAELALAPESLDAIAAFYSLIHLPREEQVALLARLAAWLRPGGLLVATMGMRADPGSVDGFFGEPMYWSGYSAEQNRQAVASAGLRVLSAEEHSVDEFGESVTFLWVMARRPECGASDQ